VGEGGRRPGEGGSTLAQPVCPRGRFSPPTRASGDAAATLHWPFYVQVTRSLAAAAAHLALPAVAPPAPVEADRADDVASSPQADSQETDVDVSLCAGDALAADLEVLFDTGETPAKDRPPAPGGGCGSTAASSSAFFLWLAICGLLAARRRGRRARPQTRTSQA
jgi:hypothetical protein